MIRIDIKQLNSKAASQPHGYLEDVIGNCVSNDGKTALIEEDKYNALVSKYYGSRVVRFFNSLSEWMKAGFKVVDQSEFDKRTGLCANCESSDGVKNWKNGTCRLCGCLKLKLVFPHERCPIGKW